MRPTLPSALILMLSASVFSASFANAAESSPPAASSGGTQKSGKRPAEGEKKAATPAAPASGAGNAAAADTTKRKTSPAKPAAQKAGTEDERFANARKAASEDPKILELREKADLAKNKDAGERAMRAYLKALYGKMRTLEPSLEERISLTEEAALKAISKPE